MLPATTGATQWLLPFGSAPWTSPVALLGYWDQDRLTGLTIAFHLCSRAAHIGAATVEVNRALGFFSAGFFTAERCEAHLDKVLSSFRLFCHALGRAHPGHPSHLCALPMPMWSVTNGGYLTALGSAAVQQLTQSWVWQHPLEHPTVRVGISGTLRSIAGDRQNYSGSPLHISALLLSASSPALLPPNWGWQNKKCVSWFTARCFSLNH